MSVSLFRPPRNQRNWQCLWQAARDAPSCTFGSGWQSKGAIIFGASNQQRQRRQGSPTRTWSRPPGYPLLSVANRKCRYASVSWVPFMRRGPMASQIQQAIGTFLVGESPVTRLGLIPASVQPSRRATGTCTRTCLRDGDIS